ncbi:hypothetical protein [Streptosporangium sandarakinum]|uniref:Uncharacterized protein n=1 Tax=Streptosporangium sandarakinum TaxID=1260955 RepID=A0A852UUV0_9ACTN|nr:hypothetical protein [Streptosporangium sandarakinum]NYF41467.1 hypothetical protein [Streptosporangium sandarakinum]
MTSDDVRTAIGDLVLDRDAEGPASRSPGFAGVGRTAVAGGSGEPGPPARG